VRTITVARQGQRYGAAVEVRASKYGSERTVYAAPVLLEILAQHVAAHCPREDPSRWLFDDGHSGDDARRGPGRCGLCAGFCVTARL
jgi:hypothetical protein